MTTTPAPTPPARLTIPSRYIALAGILVAALILGSIATITIRTVLSTRERLDSVAAARGVSRAYSDMELGIAQASIHSTRLRETGEPQEKIQILYWVRTALEADARVKALGDDSDRAFMTSLEDRFGDQLTSGLAILGGANPSDPAFDADNQPLILDQIVAALTDPADRAKSRTDVNLKDLQDTFDVNSRTILLVLAMGVPLLFFLFLLINRYERKDAIKASELVRLGEAALTDGLTGLGNHRAFQEEVRREVARAARNATPISIVMIDVDDFKEINDSLGHAHGDTVLSDVGQLMAYMRSADRAYRVGGDEFALIMPDTDAQAAYVALERLRRSVLEAFSDVTISAGICTSPNGAGNATQLRDQADSALYEAKHRGKNRVIAYDSSLDQGTELTAAKMQSLRDVLGSRDISMWFQPIFRFGSKQILAFEALLRLPGHPDFAGPEDAFITAQHMGRTDELDIQCTEQALAAARDLPPGTKIFINLEPATLLHANFHVDQLASLVDAAGVERSNVVFEMTEKTELPLPRLIRQIGAIRELGFAVALDDAGAGSSGLELLRLAHFDYVKIDRSVVLSAIDGGPGRAIILAIVAFARESNAFMIAEGIENQEMLDAVRLDADGLKRFWIKGVQGFLLGEPRSTMAAFMPAKGASAA